MNDDTDQSKPTVTEDGSAAPEADLLDIVEELGLPYPGEPEVPAPSTVLAQLRADER